ncbi:GNAT family N-acetyltransferase [Viridibacillus arvi]|uniref:GNAT family N-acetyltransferase n=1 Tax=Viridibacillus arvi TaxID=263475 RepID=UPI003CFD81C0
MKTHKITTQEDLQKAFDIRVKVFVEEQKVPAEEEIDQFDHLGGECHHILVTNDEDQAVGTGRIRLVEGVGKIQRVAILEEYRKLGLGRVIIQALEDIASKELGASKVKLDGQVQAQGFYEKLGYHVASDIFLDAGIEHVLMIKEV